MRTVSFIFSFSFYYFFFSRISLFFGRICNYNGNCVTNQCRITKFIICLNLIISFTLPTLYMLCINAFQTINIHNIYTYSISIFFFFRSLSFCYSLCQKFKFLSQFTPNTNINNNMFERAATPQNLHYQPKHVQINCKYLFKFLRRYCVHFFFVCANLSQ